MWNVAGLGDPYLLQSTTYLLQQDAIRIRCWKQDGRETIDHVIAFPENT